MSRATRTSLFTLWTLAAWSMMLTSANAYIDAGSTSVIFQAIIAFLAAAGTGFAMFRQKITSFLRRNKAGESTQAPDGEHV